MFNVLTFFIKCFSFLFFAYVLFSKTDCCDLCVFFDVFVIQVVLRKFSSEFQKEKLSILIYNHKSFSYMRLIL